MRAEDAEHPPAFVCPITQEVMRDPVTAADGHSYEASAIATWLRSSDLSPLTGQRLQHKNLTRSHALRNAIQEHEQARLARQRKQRLSEPAAPVGAKLILLGDSAVGKSSLVHRIKEGTFSAAASQPTIGCSFCPHAVTLPDGAKVNLAIWDTAGQEKYRAFTRQYFRGASAAVVLYDITFPASFEGAQRWLTELHSELPPPPQTVLLLVGAKLDMLSERKVPKDEAEQMARRYSAAYLECSSKEGTNVELVFERIAQTLRERGLDGGANRASQRIQVSALPPQRRSSSVGAAGCCV